MKSLKLYFPIHGMTIPLKASAMIYALNFDLQTPNFNDVKVVSLHQILDINNNHKIKTSKRLGFKFSSETNND